MSDQEKRLGIARAKLLRQYEFQGRMLMILDHRMQEGIGTAGTDGKSVIYEPAFVASLSDEMLLTLLCHEAEHVIRMHPFRLGKRDRRRWNAACDHTVNLSLRDQGLTLPPDGLCDDKYSRLAEEQVYARLENESGKKSRKGGQGEPGGSGGSGGSDGSEDDCPEDWGKVLAPGGSQQERVDSENRVKLAVAQIAKACKSRGTLPEWAEQFVDILKPVYDWREHLLNLMTSISREDYSWNRINRRYIARGMWMPGPHSHSMGTIVVCIDTSGSCCDAQSEFLGHLELVREQCNPEKTYGIFCDSAVDKVIELEANDCLEPKTHGGGGTSFAPPFDWLEARGIEPAVLIYLTDGDGIFPALDPGYPVIWAMTTDVDPPFGATVRVK